MSQEQIPTWNQERKTPNEQDFAEIEATATERRNERLETQTPENRPDSREATTEALEHAKASEKERQITQETTVERSRHHDRSPGKKERDDAYSNIMDEVRENMSPSSKAFSKFIHAPLVENASETIGSTIARPNAILAGGISAFSISLLIYMVARYYGYPLSGTESIAAFAAGWILGIIFDYLRILITGKKH